MIRPRSALALTRRRYRDEARVVRGSVGRCCPARSQIPAALVPPRASATRLSVAVFVGCCPLSMRETTDGEVPIRRATSAWERPSAARRRMTIRASSSKAARRSSSARSSGSAWPAATCSSTVRPTGLWVSALASAREDRLTTVIGGTPFGRILRAVNPGEVHSTSANDGALRDDGAGQRITRTSTPTSTSAQTRSVVSTGSCSVLATARHARSAIPSPA